MRLLRARLNCFQNYRRPKRTLTYDDNMADDHALYRLLSVDLILLQICLNLHFTSILRLAATSKPLQSLLYTNPSVFRCVDASVRRRATVYSRSIRPEDVTTTRRFEKVLTPTFQDHVFRRLRILNLDGQSGVIIHNLSKTFPGSSIPLRILSIRRIQYLRGDELFEVLSRFCEGDASNRLQGVYVFDARQPAHPVPGPREVTAGVTARLGAALGQPHGAALGQPHGADEAGLHNSLDPMESAWHQGPGWLTQETRLDFLQLFQLPLYYDSILCRSRRHTKSADGPPPLSCAYAQVVPSPCEICGSAPEGLIDQHSAPSHNLPLLAPLPRSPSIKLAQRPFLAENRARPFLARCQECLRARWCHDCGRFWCEDCYAAERSSTGDPVNVWPAWGVWTSSGSGPGQPGVTLKVYDGLCIEHCLVPEMYSGTGSGGMWA